MNPWIKPRPDPLGCYDCGLRYGGPGWMDAVVPNGLWERISPSGDEGGILCISCMAARCDALGLSRVPFEITSGPFADHSLNLDGHAMQENAGLRFSLKKIATPQPHPFGGTRWLGSGEMAAIATAALGDTDRV